MYWKSHFPRPAGLRAIVAAVVLVLAAVPIGQTVVASDPCVGDCSAPAGVGSGNPEDHVPNINAILQYTGQTRGGLVDGRDDLTTVEEVISWVAEEVGSRLGAELDPTGGGEQGAEVWERATGGDEVTTPSELLGDQYRDAVERTLNPNVELPAGIPDGDNATRGENCFAGRTVYGPIAGCIGGS